MFDFYPLKEITDLPTFYKDYVLKVSGETDIKNVTVKSANGLFQMIMDSADTTFSYEDDTDLIFDK